MANLQFCKRRTIICLASTNTRSIEGAHARAGSSLRFRRGRRVWLASSYPWGLGAALVALLLPLPLLLRYLLCRLFLVARIEFGGATKLFSFPQQEPEGGEFAICVEEMRCNTGTHPPRHETWSWKQMRE